MYKHHQEAIENITAKMRKNEDVLAFSNMVLNGGRAILAYNELLFPYHKWFLRVLENAPQKPDNLMSLIYRLIEERSPEAAADLVKAIDGFTHWGIKSTDWAQFVMGKNELGVL